MNKIETAIHKAKLFIKDKEKQLLIVQTELNCLKEHLQILELIQENKSIPNQIDNLVETPSNN